MFRGIVEAVAPAFPSATHDVAGRECIPLELKVRLCWCSFLFLVHRPVRGEPVFVGRFNFSGTEFTTAVCSSRGVGGMNTHAYLNTLTCAPLCFARVLGVLFELKMRNSFLAQQSYRNNFSRGDLYSYTEGLLRAFDSYSCWCLCSAAGMRVPDLSISRARRI